MIFVFYILAALLIWLSYKSLRGGIDYLNYFKKELARTPAAYTPFASIIAPCKGLDNGLEKNLTALLEQVYPSYEVIFVIDDKDDPAVSVIENTINRGDAETPSEDIIASASQRLGGEKLKLVIASKATESSQKVENLREAVLHVSDRSEVFVFVDSDVRPARDWLRSLVAPLEDVNIGAATGYRWFISERQTLASELRNIWNASIASALGPDTKSNFCWGGSTAIRRHTFEKLDIRGKWRGTLSDDFTVSRAMWAAKLPIHFVPEAVTPSIEDCTFRKMVEFTTRQMKITRVYAQRLWLMSFLGSGLFCIVMATAFLIAVLSHRNGIEVFIAIATVLIVSGLSIAKSWIRLKAIRLVLTQYEADLRKQILSQLTLWLISPFIFLYNCTAALLSRRLVWRGTKYELISNTQTRVIKRTSSQ